MGSVSGIISLRSMAVVGTVLVSALFVACAPQPGGTAPTTTTSTTLPWSEPTGTWTSFDMTCSANVLGAQYPFAQAASVNVEAPLTVQQGETFDMTVAPGPFVVPTNVQGFALTSMSSVRIRFPLSSNAQFVDSVMSAGINMGSGYPSLTIVGTDMVYRVPGPLAPGSTVQLPKVRVTLTATGAAGSTIEVRKTTLSNVANVGGVDVPTTCTPDQPNPLFWATTITPG